MTAEKPNPSNPAENLNRGVEPRNASDHRSKRTAFSEKYSRYAPLVERLAKSHTIEPKAIQRLYANENPAFITRTINELVNQGWLVEEKATGYFLWNTGRGKFSPRKWLDEKLLGVQIKAGPERERPRERLLEHGAGKLQISELIAILIRSGRPGESAVIAGRKLAREFENRLDYLASAGRGELKAISPAVEKTAYCQIMAGIELGRRIAAITESRPNTQIAGSTDAIQYCQNHFRRLAFDGKQEEFHIVTLDTKNQVIDSHQITIGTLDASLVHPREVFRAAIKDSASSILLAHNHPSGDPTPSREDHAVTRRLTECGETLGIDVLDHIVLGKGRAVSIRECE